MGIKALVADDSAVVRSLLKQVLLSFKGIESVDTVSNGRLAIGRLTSETYDLLILDLEMPELDGLGTLREIQERSLGVRVLVFAAQTAVSAQQSLEALRRGAWDVVAKPESANFEPELLQSSIRTALAPHITELMLLGKAPAAPQASPELRPVSAPAETASAWPRLKLETYKPSLIVIASSTGGPKALEGLFAQLKAPFRVPILIVQHMPPIFTQMLAENLTRITGLPATEGRDGAELKKGMITIAPGNFHMSLQKSGGGLCIKLDQEGLINSVRPAADRLFASAAAYFGHLCLGIVLTGMGEDGKKGAIAIKEAGGAVAIQDEASSVVWGMPGSVFEANAYDQVESLDRLASLLVKWGS